MSLLIHFTIDGIIIINIDENRIYHCLIMLLKKLYYSEGEIIGQSITKLMRDEIQVRPF